MKLFFWQNINSIHQSEFFREMANNNNFDTTLIVTEKISPERVEMGWGNPKIKGLSVIDLSVPSIKWKSIIEQNNDQETIHMFSGIDAFPKIYKSLRHAIKKKCRVAVFTEPYDFRGLKGSIRKLRGYFYKLRYEKNIEFILATGMIGVEQFIKFGFPQNKVFEWAYSVEKSNNSIYDKINTPVRIIFAGSLTKRKGYDILLYTLEKLQTHKVSFIANLYCLKKDNYKNANDILLKYNITDGVFLRPFLPNLELRKKISEHDFLILPSRHDGWGAVVNESLAEGTPVIVSNKCGSSTLINQFNGQVLDGLSFNILYNALFKFIKKGPITKKEREIIKSNYEQKVSGIVLVKYLQDIINYTNKKRIGIKPVSPWIQT